MCAKECVCVSMCVQYVSVLCVFECVCVQQLHITGRMKTFTGERRVLIHAAG